MEYYRLEYNSDDNNLFHMDNGSHQENTFGWSTIDIKAEDRAASNFIRYFKKYHADRKYEPYEVKLMWKLFNGVVA